MDESELGKHMQEVLDLVTSDVASIRTGRATSALVEDVQVSVYGGAQKLKINEVGTITTPDTQTIVIDPWDKSIIGEIKKGIEFANIGLTPSLDGEIIRIILSPMTTEDREKYVKLLHTKLENGKVMIRQVRADAMKSVSKAFEAKELSEDEKFGSEKRIQDKTDEFISKIDNIGKAKEAEILQI